MQSLFALGAVLSAVTPAVLVGLLVVEQIQDPLARAGLLLAALMVISAVVMVAADVSRDD